MRTERRRVQPRGWSKWSLAGGGGSLGSGQQDGNVNLAGGRLSAENDDVCENTHTKLCGEKTRRAGASEGGVSHESEGGTEGKCWSSSRRESPEMRWRTAIGVRFSD
ncbi:hypothetical protein Salat_0880400 [Sesamum alatum]|uniref:Uncharacterized protein n=1 Tax=Sesamum alatum TaxID=300844 RepID=A0AAE1YJL0_9LAMI|nr:hypothetical protein Salat_0880400 [Sesamum alatum]